MIWHVILYCFRLTDSSNPLRRVLSQQHIVKEAWSKPAVYKMSTQVVQTNRDSANNLETRVTKQTSFILQAVLGMTSTPVSENVAHGTPMRLLLNMAPWQRNLALLPLHAKGKNARAGQLQTNVCEPEPTIERNFCRTGPLLRQTKFTTTFVFPRQISSNHKQQHITRWFCHPTIKRT